MIYRRCFSLLLFIWVIASVGARDDDLDWRTLVHNRGLCAMKGICGKRKDGDPLNCPSNSPSEPPSNELAEAMKSVCPTVWAEQKGDQGTYCCDVEQVQNIASSTQKVLPFVVACPACHHNFIYFWCALSCSPDQATFTNVSAVQMAYSNNATAVAEVDYWVDPVFGENFFNSCKDVKFGAANVPSMNFIGGGATDYQAWLDFLGLVKDKRPVPVGSPFQQNFHKAALSQVQVMIDGRIPEKEPGGEDRPADFSGAFSGNMIACGENSMRCSCSDCPTASSCAPPDPNDSSDVDCHCHVGVISCFEFSMIFIYTGLLGALIVKFRRWSKTSAAGQHLKGLIVKKAQVFHSTSDVFDVYDSNPMTDGKNIKYPPLERMLQGLFYRLGLLCARYPGRVIAVSLISVSLCCIGFVRFRVETDPQKLWVGPTSQAAKDRAAFESSFEPFYRITQIILATTALSQGPYESLSGMPSIINLDNIRLMFEIQEEVDALIVPAGGGEMHNVTLNDVCYKPFGDICATQSLLQYWKMDRDYFEREQARSGRMKPEYCFGRWYTECRSAFQAPIDPHVVLGGFPTDVSAFRNYTADTTSFIITLPLSSHQENIEAARLWEAALINLAQTRLTDLAAAANLSITFSAERSVQDELQRESSSDAVTVAFSYCAMLLYIAVALGSLPSRHRPWEIFILSRASLALGGVLIVALSVAGALGLISACGIWSTLIIMEVIPFLVLAVGVDNMFMLAHAIQRQPTGPLSDRVASALASVGPSITLAASCEVMAFGVAFLFTPMPAVRNFSLCACFAVLLDFILQVTAFVSLLVLDTQRIESNRIDCIPCMVLPVIKRVRDPHKDGLWRALHGRSYGGVDPLSESLMEEEEEPQLVAGGTAPIESTLQAALHYYMHNLHIPMLLNKPVQLAVLMIFLTGGCLSMVAIPHLSVGLDQSVALPQDSYLQSYYRRVFSDLRVGPPLFLVVKNLNISREARDINRVCSVSGCEDNSVLNQIAHAARSPRHTFIASPAASWIDDFISWLSPSLPSCCREHNVPQEPPQMPGPPQIPILSSEPSLPPDSISFLPRPWDSAPEKGSRSGYGVLSEDLYCPPTDQPPCVTDPDACADCKACITVDFEGGRPSLSQFQKYLPWFMEALPSEACAKGGAGVYSDAIQRGAGGTQVLGLDQGIVSASSFRAFYTPLNNQKDFISALKSTRRLVSDMTLSLRLQVYCYSPFHVFFEQYLSIYHDGLLLVGLPMLLIFFVSWALTASLSGSLILVSVLSSLLLHLLGIMLLADIQLNAVSLVNLAMALGIAVEFCAHLNHAFGVAAGSHSERMVAALEKTGASVISGIILTKLVGVVVLAFAQTRIFLVYYFRLYLALVVLGITHGLVLLPVILNLIGPSSMVVVSKT